MGMKSALGLAIVGVAAIAGGVYYYAGHQAKPVHEAGLATPPGIVFATVKMGNAVYVPGASSDQQAEFRVFADPKGMTLYSFDKDTVPGKSACSGDCAKAWPAMAAPADAKPVGDWTIITRDDGSKQWAYRGKPLYLFAKDMKTGDYKGDGVDGAWHIAYANAGAGMTLPDGIAVREVAEAGGQALVDSHGMVLYAFDGELKHDKIACNNANPCPGNFVPVAAGGLANPVGDFGVVSRDDGVQQWTYQGRPLYTYDGDIDLGDANGIGLDQRYQVAMITKYFMPPGVSIRPDERRGGLLTNAQGMTLYARDKLVFNGTGGHNARGGTRGNPMIGKMIGTSGCDAQCEQTWIPLKAAPGSQPSGYWSLIARADGSQQWAYQGYALYSYTGDKKPGDTIGHDTFNLFVNDEHSAVQQVAATTASTNTVLDHGLGLYWRITAP